MCFARFASPSIRLGALLIISGLSMLCASAPAATTHDELVGDTAKSSSPGNNADFSLDLAYHAPAHTLTVTLTDTTPAGAEGLLTGFVFNLDRAGYVTKLTSSSDGNFKDLTAPRNHHFAPLASTYFGTYQAGAALGGVFAWSPNFSGGLQRGQTGTFTFDVAGRHARKLTATDFALDGFLAAFENSGIVNVPAGAPGGNGGGGGNGNGGGSGAGDPVPLPSAVWAGLLGLMTAGGSLSLRRRQSRIA